MEFGESRGFLVRDLRVDQFYPEAAEFFLRGQNFINEPHFGFPQMGVIEVWAFMLENEMREGDQ